MDKSRLTDGVDESVIIRTESLMEQAQHQLHSNDQTMMDMIGDTTVRMTDSMISASVAGYDSKGGSFIQ